MRLDDIATTAGAMVQVKISENTAIGQFNDSLYFTPAEWALITKAQITAAVQLRVSNWVAFVTEQSSKPPYVPTKLELLERETELQKQLEAVADQVVAVKPTKIELQAIVDRQQAALDKLKAAVTATIVVK